jgi:hypothetical protein
VQVIRFFKGKFKQARAFCRPFEPNYGKMRTPRPDTPYRLHIFLHECAHFVLHGHRRKPNHLEEYEAEQWAFARMREAGIPVPKKTMRKSRQNVGVEIVKEIWHPMLFRGEQATPMIYAHAAHFAFGRAWKRKLVLLIDARDRRDPDCMKSFLGF